MQDAAAVTISGDELLIERLRVRHATLCSYLQRFPTDEHLDRLVDAMTVGVEVLMKARARTEVDYIDKRFAEVSKEFSERLNDVVNGTTKGLSTLLEGAKEELGKLLNPRKSDSPLNERFQAIEALFEVVKKELATEYSNVKLHTSLLGELFDPNGNEEKSHLGRLKKHVEAFETRIKELFNPDLGKSYAGQLKAHLDGIFDPTAGSLTGLLDERLAFGEATSPFGKFRADVEKRLQDMLVKIVESIGDLKKEIEGYRSGSEQEAVDREKMSVKGTDFEDAALDLLMPFAQKRGDTVERVGTLAETGDSMKGDLLYRFGGGAGVVAIEAKNKQVSSIPKFTKDLLDGVRNRSADFGILVVRDTEQLPKSMGAWHFDISPDGIGYIFTNSELLELSLKFAHARLRYAAAEVGGVDVVALRVLVSAVEKRLKDAGAIKRNLTSIAETVEKVRDQLDGIVDEIRAHMVQVEGELAKAGATA